MDVMRGEAMKLAVRYLEGFAAVIGEL